MKLKLFINNLIGAGSVACSLVADSEGVKARVTDYFIDNRKKKRIIINNLLINFIFVLKTY